MRDHVIVCGYGTKGRSAIEILVGHGRDAQHDPRDRQLRRARRRGQRRTATRRCTATPRGPSVLQAAGIAERRGGHRRARPRRHRGADDADRARAQPERPDHRRRARGREPPPAAPERRRLGHHLLGRRRAAAGLRRACRRRSSRCSRTCSRSAAGSTSSSARSRPSRSASRSSALPADAPMIAVDPRRRAAALRPPRHRELRAGDQLVCLCSNSTEPRRPGAPRRSLARAVELFRPVPPPIRRAAAGRRRGVPRTTRRRRRRSR